MRHLAVIEGQTNILPRKLLCNLERKLAMNSLTVHVENSIGSGVVQHKKHEESGSENDLDDEGPILPGPTIRAQSNNRGATEKEGF